MKDKEAMAMALEALEYIDDGANNQGTHTGISWRCVSTKAEPAIAALKERLAHPPQRTWVGLTDEEILSDDTLRYYYGMNGGAGPVSQKGKKVIAAIEAKLKQKNGYAEEKNT
jgi:hypothetical protein